MNESPTENPESPNTCHCALYAVGALICIGVVVWLTI